MSLPCAALYWRLPVSLRLPMLVLQSFLLLLFMSPGTVTLLLLVSLLVYLPNGKITSRRLSFNIALLVGILAGCRSFLPLLGLSYVIFRHLHYQAEAYKGRLQPHSHWEFYAYTFFLPIQLVGPVARFPDFLRDWKRQRFDERLTSRGLERCLYGLAKVVILSDYLIVTKLHPLQALPWLGGYFKMVFFTLSGFLQLSGYSDVAIGLSLLYGFRIMENFNYPFAARNMVEFWRRYHISLSSWCYDYVYLPVAATTRKPFLALLAAVLVLSAWHEVSWRYLIWGLLQVVGVAVSHYYRGPHLNVWVARLLVFHFFAATCLVDIGR